MFVSLLSKMIFLLGLILIGYILAKAKLMPKDSARIISRLETLILMPCLIIGTLMKNCTIDNLIRVWPLLLFSSCLLIILIPISLVLGKVIFKEKHLQNIAIYGLIFSNFGFMGNAVVKSVFEEIFFEWTLFTLPFYVAIYAWAVPALLTERKDERNKILSCVKKVVNPTFVSVIIGATIGLLAINLEDFYLTKPINDIIIVLGDCMSPIAMILTGLTIGNLNLLQLLKKYKIYIMSVLRLFVFPLIYLGIVWIFNLPAIFNSTFLICGLCMLSMPLGLNTIVIPASYGKDTSDAASMSLVSHVLSLISIPIVFEILYLMI